MAGSTGGPGDSDGRPEAVGAPGIAPTMYRLVIEAHARDLADAKAEHARIAQSGAAPGSRAASRSHADGDAAAEITTAAADLGAEVIAIGSRGRTGLARAVLGSVAQNELHGSKASVLIVHEPKTSDLSES